MTPSQKARKAKKAHEFYEQFFVLFEELKHEIPWDDQQDFSDVYEAYDTAKWMRVKFECEAEEAKRRV